MAGIEVLVVDDDVNVRFGMREYLTAHGYDVVEAGTCAEAAERVRAACPHVVLLDHQLPDGNALETLPRLKALDPDLPVIILTAHGTIELAVQAIQQGAEHFLTKPVAMPALRVVLERAVAARRAHRRERAVQARGGEVAPDPFLGESQKVRELAEQARRALASDSPILILGETGSGKGVLARWLHRNGARAQEAFVDLNCAGLSRELLDAELFGYEKGAFTGASSAKPGLLEVAHRGTLFLDELGDMDLLVQAKLLKVLEEKSFRRLGEVRPRQVDVQLVAATHQDLQALVQKKLFRLDLYYRVSVIPLRVPPLRERVEDIVPLARQLLAATAAELGRPSLQLAPDAEREIERFGWAGNVRELRNVMERAALHARGTEIGARDLNFELAAPSGPGEPADSESTLEELQRRHIERVLAEEGGHVERAAARLGLPRSTLYQKIKSLGLSR